MLILIFLINIIEMVYELVASRVIAPYYGNGNYTMTAVIAVMLLSGSLGNMLGGKLTKTKYKYQVLSASFAIGALMIVVSASGISLVSALLNSSFSDLRIAVSLCSLLFFLPALAMGIFTPIAMDDILNKLPKEAIGEANGKIHAVIAIGSLTGTILGGFVLIPVMGTVAILIVITIFMFLISTGYLIYAIQKQQTPKLIQIKKILFSPTVICLLITGICFSDALANLKVYHGGNITNEMSFDTTYGRIIVYDTVNDQNEPIRVYDQGNEYASATFLSPDKKYDAVFQYISTYEYAHEYLDIDNALMIGGAAYQYPKLFIHLHPDKHMDVVDINGECINIAKRYFFLDDLFEEYGEDCLNCITADGRIYLQQTDKTYDAIFNDAFSGGSAVATLCTVEFAQMIKSKLNPGGVYLCNAVGQLDGNKGTFIRSEVKTLSQVFKNVYLLPTTTNTSNDHVDNWMIVATDNDYRPDIAKDLLVLNSDYILTDDFCPVEILNAYQFQK